jgi:hypothetical protein
MREHQIVITLKPDQFLEVQRLARAANAKSMGIFVRQKLLAALGIEGAEKGGQVGEAAPKDIQPLVEELRQLHCDLKSFVAESLSIYIPETGGQPIEALSVSVEQSHSPSDVGEDEVEQAAKRAFAISPRLGAVEAPASESAQQGAESMQRRGSQTREAAEPAVEKHENHRRRDVHRPHADEALLAPPNAVAESAVRDPLSELLGPEESHTPAPENAGEDEDDFEFAVQMNLGGQQPATPAEDELPSSQHAAAPQTADQLQVQQSSIANAEHPAPPAGLTEQIRAARAAAEQDQSAHYSSGRLPHQTPAVSEAPVQNPPVQPAQPTLDTSAQGPASPAGNYSTGRWVNPADSDLDQAASDESSSQNRPPNLPLSGGPPPKRRRV